MPGEAGAALLESKGRTDMYNKDHRGAAVRLGYVSGWSQSNEPVAPTRRIRQEMATKARSEQKKKKKTACGMPFDIDKFRKKFERKFGSSLKWLDLNAEGWHYGYLLPQSQVPKSRAYHGRQRTFYIFDWKKKQEGYGAWYPYHHQYHHMLPESALHKYLIGNDDKVKRRVEIVCASKWNINKGLNIVLLPQEIAVSKIVGLPAHCPWGARSHPTYSRSIQETLKKAKMQLDKAMKTKDCEDAEEVAFQLDNTCEKLLKKIKAMKPGRQLGRVK